MDDDRLDAWLGGRDEARPYQRVEVITGRRQRRQWTAEEKAEIVAASAAPGACISDVARRYGVNRGLLTSWRREAGISKRGGRRDGQEFAQVVMEAPAPQEATASPLERRPGRIDVVVDGGHAVLSGHVDPALAVAVVGALRRPR
ncbi:IS66-like element accessory protein TnpA [Caenispirillum salinarum]|uniref:IS66-like element accessory protein TnpA n=1 Tax=Caenispirillum salinarum TaxID=859058 RepID=UPI003850F7C6